MSRYIRDSRLNVYEVLSDTPGGRTFRRVGFYDTKGNPVAKRRNELPKNKKERRKEKNGLPYETK